MPTCLSDFPSKFLLTLLTPPYSRKAFFFFPVWFWDACRFQGLSILPFTIVFSNSFSSAKFRFDLTIYLKYKGKQKKKKSGMMLLFHIHWSKSCIHTSLFHTEFHGIGSHLIKLVDCVYRNYVESVISSVAFQFASWFGGTYVLTWGSLVAQTIFNNVNVIFFYIRMYIFI